MHPGIGKIVSSVMSRIWIFVLVAAFAQAEKQQQTVISSVTETETVEYGPVTVVLDNMANIAVNVSDETSIQLQTKMERTIQDIQGNIELLATNAMQQLSDDLYEANQLFNVNPDCNPDWNLNAFTGNLSDQLDTCTEVLSNMVDDFRTTGQQLVASVQGLVKEIALLPSICQLVNAGPTEVSFAGGTNCFLRRITDINQNMSKTLNEASVLLVRTRQNTEHQVAEAQECTNSLVAQFTTTLNALREMCQ